MLEKSLYCAVLREQQKALRWLSGDDFRPLLRRVAKTALREIANEWHGTLRWREKLSTHRCGAECAADREARGKRAAAQSARKGERIRRAEEKEACLQAGEARVD